MNIINKKNLIIFAVIFLLQLLYAPNLKAQEVNEIYEEELPATDPFIGGVTIATTPDSDTETNSLGISIMQNMRLVGTISGAHKKIAVLAMPDGRVIKYEENYEERTCSEFHNQFHNCFHNHFHNLSS